MSDLKRSTRIFGLSRTSTTKAVLIGAVFLATLSTGLSKPGNAAAHPTSRIPLANAATNYSLQEGFGDWVDHNVLQNGLDLGLSTDQNPIVTKLVVNPHSAVMTASCDIHVINLPSDANFYANQTSYQNLDRKRWYLVYCPESALRNSNVYQKVIRPTPVTALDFAPGIANAGETAASSVGLTDAQHGAAYTMTFSGGAAYGHRGHHYYMIYSVRQLVLRYRPGDGAVRQLKSLTLTDNQRDQVVSVRETWY